MSRFPGLEALILRTLEEEGEMRAPENRLAEEYFWLAASRLQARGLVVADQRAGAVRKPELEDSVGPFPAEEPVEQVPCPVCAGDGRLSYHEPGGCLCCKGVGTISRKRDELLAGIRRDIAARLAGCAW